ncbi:hypothetical protein [Anaerosporobacter sp.]|uniref:hypothetical protein n=1 Tax=Anaerosporobacter sp. TaxID=1872529 RepID=UPI00286F980C|nr:hypothetical protein [Anaerosporobacter sp.]
MEYRELKLVITCGDLVEQYENVSLDKDSADYIEKRLTKSALVDIMSTEQMVKASDSQWLVKQLNLSKFSGGSDGTTDKKNMSAQISSVAYIKGRTDK